MQKLRPLFFLNFLFYIVHCARTTWVHGPVKRGQHKPEALSITSSMLRRRIVVHILQKKKYIQDLTSEWKEKKRREKIQIGDLFASHI